MLCVLTYHSCSHLLDREIFCVYINTYIALMNAAAILYRNDLSKVITIKTRYSRAVDSARTRTDRRTARRLPRASGRAAGSTSRYTADFPSVW